MDHLAVVPSPGRNEDSGLPPAGYLADLAGSSLDKLVVYCAHAFGVSVVDLIDYDRKVPLVEYRQVSMAALYELGGLSYPKIGRAFSQRDHKSVFHACRKVAGAPPLSALRDRLVSDLQAYVLGAGE